MRDLAPHGDGVVHDPMRQPGERSGKRNRWQSGPPEASGKIQDGISNQLRRSSLPSQAPDLVDRTGQIAERHVKKEASEWAPGQCSLTMFHVKQRPYGFVVRGFCDSSN